MICPLRRASAADAFELIGSTLHAALTKGPLNHILKNRMYRGEINHKRGSFKADHAQIVEAELFKAVQQKLKANLNRAELCKGRFEQIVSLYFNGF